MRGLALRENLHHAQRPALRAGRRGEGQTGRTRRPRRLDEVGTWTGTFRTLRGLCGSVKRAAFGTYRIQDIVDDQVEALVQDMGAAGKSKRTVGKMLGTLRSVFQLAMRKSVLRVNPAQDVEPVGRASRARDALTTAELEAIRRAVAGDPWEACWMLTLAGLRRSELLALHWTDFDPGSGALTINKCRGIFGGEQGPKTAKGARVLPLDQERSDLLRSLRASQALVYAADQVETGYICINEYGRPMRPEDWSERWRAWCKATAGVRDTHTLHAARHSTVTFMRNAGVPDHLVAAWHGHDEVVMRQTYSHPRSSISRRPLRVCRLGRSTI